MNTRIYTSITPRDLLRQCRLDMVMLLVLCTIAGNQSLIAANEVTLGCEHSSLTGEYNVIQDDCGNEEYTIHTTHDPETGMLTISNIGGNGELIISCQVDGRDVHIPAQRIRLNDKTIVVTGAGELTERYLILEYSCVPETRPIACNSIEGPVATHCLAVAERKF